MRYCKPNPNRPIDLLIWTSRSYLSSVVHGVPSRRQLREEISGYGGDVLLQPLKRVWDVMLASSYEPVQMHELDCPCLSPHEQALLMALQQLRQRKPRGCAVTLCAVLPTAAAQALIGDMRQLADALNSLQDGSETDKPRDSARRTTGRPELRVVH